MGFSTTADNAALTGIKTASPPPTFIALLNSSGTEISGGTYARVATTWGTVSGGSMTGLQVTINVPASTTIHQWAIYDAVTAGNQYYVGNLPADQTFASAGTYLLTPTVTASG